MLSHCKKIKCKQRNALFNFKHNLRKVNCKKFAFFPYGNTRLMTNLKVLVSVWSLLFGNDDSITKNVTISK